MLLPLLRVCSNCLLVLFCLHNSALHVLLPLNKAFRVQLLKLCLLSVLLLLGSCQGFLPCHPCQRSF